VAKKGTTTRVFNLARELSVSSKDVIAKCQTEDIPGITNHMSAVSLGLAATIREWFSDEGSVATAVQTAAPVDVAKARAKVKKKATKKAVKKKTKEAVEPETRAPRPPVEVKAPPSEETTPVAPEAVPATPVEVPVVEVPAEQAPVIDVPAVEVPTGPTTGPTIGPETGPAIGLGGPATPEIPVAPAAPAIAATVADEIAVPSGKLRQPVMNVPVRPAVVAPAGPKLEQPTKTTLAGPKVIRIDPAESVPPPQPRRVSRVGRDGPSRGGRGAGTQVPDHLMPGAPPRDGRGAGAGAGAGAGGASRRNKRRSASAGRDSGRSSRTSIGGMGAARPFNWREQDLLERERRLNRSAGFLKQARRDSQKRSGAGGHRTLSAAHTGGIVKIDEPVTLKGMSAATGVKVNDIIRQMVADGDPVADLSVVLSAEKATELMVHFGIELDVAKQQTAEQQIVEQFKEREMVDERSRSPVVTILGHVDHGKTTLLDRIRDANVAEGVVVLVVAADDGVMPQTIESINHAKAAGVPIVVALNKVDKPEATDSNIQRILGQLAEHELNPVDWGGQTEIIRISALKGEGVQDLLEVLDYQAQLLELNADFGGPAEGTVIEAQMEEGRGPVARILVQQGELKKGDFIVAGRGYGRVRDIVDDHGKRGKCAGPSTPVAVSGISEVPDAGDRCYVVKSLREAEAAAAERRDQERQRDLAKEKVTLDNIFEKLQEADRKELPLIVKADVQGSLETLKATLVKIGSDEVVVTIKHAAVGGVNESDVSLAEAAGAIVVGFNVTAAAAARRAADAKGVDIRFYDVIYDLTDDVTRAAEGLLDPELKLEVLGHAEVREVFKISKVGVIAGCYVTEGTIERNAQIRVTRGDIVVEKDRRLEQLKRFKDDAKSVSAGQ